MFATLHSWAEAKIRQETNDDLQKFHPFTLDFKSNSCLCKQTPFDHVCGVAKHAKEIKMVKSRAAVSS